VVIAGATTRSFLRFRGNARVSVRFQNGRMESGMSTDSLGTVLLDMVKHIERLNAELDVLRYTVQRLDPQSSEAFKTDMATAHDRVKGTYDGLRNQIRALASGEV
jgi:hypothetical protein